MIKSACCATVISLAFACLSQAATDRYVDNQATGAQTGLSWADAYTNFAVAVSNVWGAGANTGATIRVRQAVGAPDYAGGLEIGEGFADGTPEAYNRIVGWTGEGYLARPVIRLSVAGTAAVPQHHIRLGTTNAVSRNFYEFRGLRFHGSSDYYCYALTLYYASSNMRFVDNTCYKADCSIDDEIALAGVLKTNILVQANTFESGAQIRLRYASHVEILDNTLTTAVGGAGVVGNINNWNVRIAGNIMACNDCISWQNGSDTVIENNRFKAAYRGAVWVDWNPQNALVIRNNLFHDITGSHASYPNGVGIYVGHGSSATPALVIANNTFHNFPETGSTAIYLNQYIDKGTVFNNVFSGVTTGLTFEAGCASTNNYNAFWQVAVPHAGAAVVGADDRAANPLFRDAAALDFRLGNDTLKFSAAKTFNTIAAPTNDYFGAPRGTVISFGAVESPADGMKMILR